VILLLQVATGLSNVVLEWPLLAAVLHSGGAALLVALLVVTNIRAALAGGR
jgi:cytochrome c oxidase assembly protein subunit 15